MPGAPFTVVVPLAPAHDKYIPQLLDNLSHESDLIDQCVIARSELPHRDLADFTANLNHIAAECRFTAPTTVTSTADKALAGENRNRGWANANSPWVAFLDADDIYSPWRLRRLLGVIEIQNPNLIVHDYWLSHDDWAFPAVPPTSPPDIVLSPEISAMTFPNGVRLRGQEGLVPGGTNLRLPEGPHGSRHVHHAHVVVRNSVGSTVRYGDLYRMEDGQFCRDVLFELGSVVYVAEKLSVYRIEASTAGRPLLKRAARHLRRAIFG